ncbi:UNVERIFIED_ORG: N-acyl-L-homoserine lactone synthetase [Rhizobium etli]|uniref:acyl-homoserine-lactone synthase n=1 Tax=Rhizobium TaxID=379 RepID=UPI0007B6083B|nr:MULTISPECIES: acyl-homoserine-lactone synthase [Rhizobium]MBB4420750.1 N-acyl-L-homoserine lactone synthetase [Rhizobium leguminosarum]PON08452.1 hypothetical protein ATY29_05475 [Rhizobium hidalgonense]
MVKSSRFCVDTTLEERRRSGSVHEITLTRFAGIIEWCLANGYAEVKTGLTRPTKLTEQQAINQAKGLVRIPM